MNRIDGIFAGLRASGRRALMPFVCGGHPGPGITERVLPALERAGASIVEVGIPFSDPIADGPVIAAAMHEALVAGATPASVMAEVGRARPGVTLGLVAMVSISIVFRVGEAEFVRRAGVAGFDGFIFPDLPLEESGSLRGRVRDAGMTASLLVAPTTPPARAEQIAKASTGFVYLLTRTGITGDQGGAPPPAPEELAQRVKALRAVTDLPIACGFGISTARQVQQVAAHADAAIVGSALVRRMSDAARRGDDPVLAAEEFTRGLAAPLRGPAS